MSRLENALSEFGYLVGRQPLVEFVSTIRRATVGGDLLSQEQLCREWRDARARVLELEADEAGRADSPVLDPLPRILEGRANAFVQDKAVAKELSLFPFRWAMVELDRLVIYQHTVDWGFVDHLSSRLSSDLSLQDIFDFVMHDETAAPQVTAARLSETTFHLASASADFRFLDAMFLNATSPQFAEFGFGGRPTNAIGVVLGYGLNYFSAIAFRDRLYLGNRSHHILALKRLGIARVPCIVQQITHEEELSGFMGRQIRSDSAQYLRSRRPPMFMDYLDPRQCKRYPVLRKRHIVEIEINVRLSKIPA